MTIKWIGAALIIVGCGGFGLLMASGARKEGLLLEQLILTIGVVASELEYHLTPLPDLLVTAAGECDGVLRDLFQRFSAELSCRTQPDAESCVSAVLHTQKDLSPRIRKHIYHLGRSLGRFDLTGQLQGLHSVQKACEKDLALLDKNKDIRIRSYQTLSLCAGTALVILFA